MKNKNLIVNVLAYEDEYQTSTQMGEGCTNLVIRNYLKDSFVCLKSCLMHTPDTDVKLFVNFKMAEDDRKLFEENGIGVCYLAFDKFRFPKEYRWALANYRMCVLDYVVHHMEYENILALDTDEYCVDDLSDAFAEMREGMVLFDTAERFSHSERQAIMDTAEFYFGRRINLPHIGAEFFGGNKDAMKDFLKICQDVIDGSFAKVDEKKLYKYNDEHVMSAAAYAYAGEGRIINAAPYIYRYWTIRKFFLVSTNWKYNSVCLWHMPVEKKRGIFKLYNYYMKYKRFPEKEKAAAMMGFGRSTRPFVLSDYPIVLKNRLAERAEKKRDK